MVYYGANDIRAKDCPKLGIIDARLPDSLPTFLLPDVPLTSDTFRILFPVSATLAMVGVLESLMMAQIVEDMTGTPSQRNRECIGQGVANMVAGCFGDMAGCAMIGQQGVLRSPTLRRRHPLLPAYVR